MNETKLNLHGIYDKRTLDNLVQLGIHHFGFDFNPRSFAFIQEHVFLDLIKNGIGLNDKIFLHFKNNKDCMIEKLLSDIKNIRPDIILNIFFIFDEFVSEGQQVPFYLKYSPLLPNSIQKNILLKGFVFEFSDIEDAYNVGAFNNYISNVFSKFPKIADGHLELILNTSWNDNLISSIFDFLEFNFIQLNINNEIEVCYRNVDLIKLNSEIKLKKKHLHL